MLLAAMLLSASGFAQSKNNEPLKGDMNGDGKVDVADINEIIKIMKDAGGTAEPPTYYWYVGQTQQTNMQTNPSNVLNTNDVTNEGWRKITRSTNQYTSSSPLFNSSTNSITFEGKSPTAPSYVYLPKSYVDSGLWMYDDDGDKITSYQNTNITITINGIIYNEYKRTSRHGMFAGPIIYSKGGSSNNNSGSDSGNSGSDSGNSGSTNNDTNTYYWYAGFSEPLNGDVNGDGKVDIADINEIIKIMKEAGGTSGETVYYWYAGQTKPESMSDNPTVDDINFTDGKWHTLSSTATIAKLVTGGTSGKDWYVAVPTSVGLYPTASDLYTSNTSWDNFVTDNSLEQISINGVPYTIWRPNTEYNRSAVYMAVLPEIYYFGTTQPTAENYKLLRVYESLAHINGTRVSVNSNQYIYFLCPTGAITDEQRKNAMLDNGGFIVNFSQEIDTNSISGYSIYKQFIDNAGRLKLNIQYCKKIEEL